MCHSGLTLARVCGAGSDGRGSILPAVSETRLVSEIGSSRKRVTEKL